MQSNAGNGSFTAGRRCLKGNRASDDGDRGCGAAVVGYIEAGERFLACALEMT